LGDKQRIAEWMEAHDSSVIDDSFFAPSYNVAPQTFQPVVRLDSETGERELTVMHWGLVPFWAKDTKMAFNTINAKAETLGLSSRMQLARAVAVSSGRRRMAACQRRPGTRRSSSR
jgi:putative SOS response-associated peptidase YedK